MTVAKAIPYPPALSRFSTYPWDLPLFVKLGLLPFAGDIWETIEVGEVHLESGSTVKVSVEGAPAQFWKFVIYCAETKRETTLETGSGCFGDYWLFAEKIAQGMVVAVKASNK